MIPAVISVAVFPLMSRLAHEGKEQFSLILEKTLRLMLVVALPIAIGGILFAYKIVPLIFGQAYIGAVPTLQVLMLLVIPSFPLTVLSNAIFAKNNQRKLTGAYFLGVAMNIVLNLFLVPRFGAVGASLSTLLSTCTITCFIWIELRKDIEFHVFRKLARPAIAGVVMVIATLILQKVGAEAILTMAVVGLTYFGVLFLLREPLLKEAMGIFKK
jgi:O-antigen/teichoic acid export membrane protein